jgi:hypothetical protein
LEVLNAVLEIAYLIISAYGTHNTGEVDFLTQSVDDLQAEADE